jgi:hypothetical protein
MEGGGIWKNAHFVEEEYKPEQKEREGTWRRTELVSY